MSRSKIKTPIFGRVKCKSEKYDKKLWHRKFRHKEKILLNECYEEHITVHFREVSNRWMMSKDGRYYWKNWNSFDKLWQLKFK